MDKPDIVAITEYTREDYPLVYALAPNGGGMHDSFDAWKKAADATVAAELLKGRKVIRVRIEPDKFAAWLAGKNLKSNEESRALYGHHLASRMQAN